MVLFHRLKRKDGFSIGELLVATLIMLMVSSVVAGGIPVARDAYIKVTVGANSQVLLSTAITALRNELGTASEVKVSGSIVEYTSMKTGDRTQIYLNGTEGIRIHEYMSFPSDDTIKTDRQLVIPSSATKDLYVTYRSVDEPGSDGVMVFHDLKVKKAEDGDSDPGRAELSVLKIRVFRES